MNIKKLIVAFMLIGSLQLNAMDHRPASRWQSAKQSIADTWNRLRQGTRDSIVTGTLLAAALGFAVEDMFGENTVLPAAVQSALGLAMGIGPLAKYPLTAKALAVGIEIPLDIAANLYLSANGQPHCRHTGFFALALGLMGFSSLQVERYKYEAVRIVRTWSTEELAFALFVAPQACAEIKKLESQTHRTVRSAQRAQIIKDLYNAQITERAQQIVDIDRRTLQVEMVINWTTIGALPKIEQVLMEKQRKPRGPEIA